ASAGRRDVGTVMPAIAGRVRVAEGVTRGSISVAAGAHAGSVAALSYNGHRSIRQPGFRRNYCEDFMARTDAIVLGAGIIGTSVALHLAKRGLSVALVDRRGPGEETSYGNTGIIGGAGVYPARFPARLSALARVALKRAPEANYHLAFLPQV